MTVRSTSLYTGAMPGATATLYTVPSGHTTIVKFFSLIHIGNFSANRLEIFSGGTLLAYLAFENVTSNVIKRETLWGVLEAGWELRARTDAGTPGNVRWHIAGAELLGQN